MPAVTIRASVAPMLGDLNGKLAAFYRGLTRAGEEHPIHKLALGVVVLLDLFILISIIDGLDVHTRQLAAPDERVPQLCREVVIDRAWTPDNRLDRLTDTVVAYRPKYGEPEKPNRVMHATCERVVAPIAAIAAQDELGSVFEGRQRLTRELRESESELSREKGAYDTQLLEALARPTAARPDVESILAAVQHRTAAIEAARSRLAGLDASLGTAAPVTALWAQLDALQDGVRTSLAADLRRMELWFPLKRLGMQLLFLLPLLAGFSAWHSASVRRGRGLQALIAAHLIVVAAIPVLFRVVEAVYEILPHRLLKRLFELLASWKLVALWHYLVMALAVAFALAAVLLIQRRLFSRERLLEKRITKGECQECGKRLPAGARACPSCGFGQYRSCPKCAGSMPMHARHCTECGSLAG